MRVIAEADQVLLVLAQLSGQVRKVSDFRWDIDITIDGKTSTIHTWSDEGAVRILRGNALAWTETGKSVVVRA